MRKKPARLVFSVGIFISVTLILSFVLSKSYWNGETNFTIVSGGESGDVFIYTISPITPAIIVVKVPQDTEVDVSRGFGKLKIKNLWKLSKNEKIGGLLLQETLTKSFKIPVEAFVHEKGVGLLSTNLLTRLSILFSGFETNLTTGDKLRLFFYGFRVSRENRTVIDLGQYSAFLVKSKLKDGNEGYIISEDNLPPKLIGIYTDPVISRQNLNAVVKSSGNLKIKARILGKVLEILGPKLASFSDIVNDDLEEKSCIVLAKDSYTRKKIARVFGCEQKNGEPTGNFDVEVIVGKNLFL